MKLLALLFLSGCAAQAAELPTPRGKCDPPAFTEATCYSPGGGVTRCPEADGTYWDKQPAGTATHWAWADEAQIQTRCLCKVAIQ